ncbi:MAG: type II toxin-antitoxin system HicB family antitoxin [Colwellia sp.]
MNYSIVFTPQDKEPLYDVTVPDLPGCSVRSKSIDDGMALIEKAIKSHLEILAEYGEKIPNALPLEEHRKKFTLDNPYTHQNSFWALVAIDISLYLGKSHKINVTLPELLIKQIDENVTTNKQYKTRSGFIASACLALLK